MLCTCKLQANKQEVYWQLFIINLSLKPYSCILLYTVTSSLWCHLYTASMRPNTIKHSWCCANYLLGAWTKMGQNVLSCISCIFDAWRPAGQNSRHFAATQYTLQIFNKKNREVSPITILQNMFETLQGSCLQNMFETLQGSWVNEVSRHLISKRSSFAWMITVFMKIVGHVGHFRWLEPNVRWEIWYISIEYIKPIRQLSDESWKFFSDTQMRYQFSHPGNGCPRNMPCITTMVSEKKWNSWSAQVKSFICAVKLPNFP